MVLALALATLTLLPVQERRVLLPFDYQGVRVTHGILKKQLEETKEFYLRIPNDDLLLGFRKRAGLPAPGHELGGWYSDDVFHIFGQILSGLARLYQATGDPDCKTKADALLDGWEKCIASDGYFYAAPTPNAYHYIYDKMVGGLVDMALYTGRRDAFKSLAKITGWAEKHLDRRNVYAGGGENSSTEWYTLSAIADVCDLIYFHANDGICVSLYIPSTAAFETHGTRVELTQTTRFPEEARTSFSLKLDKPTQFALHFRKAGWFAGSISARVNGKTVALEERLGHWLTIEREWKNGDQLELNLPMTFRSVPLYSTKPYPTAIAYGPVVMAFRSDSGSPTDKIDLSNVSGNFEPIPGDQLNFRLRSDPAVLVRPFYMYKQGEPYTMYLDPSAAGRVGYGLFAKQGRWQDSGRFYFGNEVGAWCEGSFTGTAVRLLGYRFDDGGRLEVSIDGTPLRMIDEYGPGRDLPGGWDFTGLSPGSHTVRVTVLAEKSPQSKNRYVNVAGLQVLK